MLKIIDVFKKIFFTKKDESEDLTKSFTHKRQDPITTRPQARHIATYACREEYDEMDDIEVYGGCGYRDNGRY